MAHTYAILGSGRQGTAAAYDLGLRADASEIRLIDSDPGRAALSAARVMRLLAELPGAPRIPAIRPVGCDVQDGKALAAALHGCRAALSAVPYRFNKEAARAAIAARCHFNDLGGNTEVVRQELALDQEARRAGVSIVPDCGLAPGMSQTLAVYAMSRVERPLHVHIRCGGLPQVPRPPLGYSLLFNVEGLTNEYTGNAVCLRDGELRELPALTEPEEVEFPMPVGKCEAFLTSGGTSTAPWTFKGTLETYEYKTVRYKGHYDRVRCLADLGFFGAQPVRAGAREVVPRDLLHALLEKNLSYPDDPDLVVLRVECSGETTYRIDLLDFYDPKTGFTAMERTTAFSAAIVTHMQATGAVAPGALPVEKAVPADRFLPLLERRGFKIVHAQV